MSSLRFALALLLAVAPAVASSQATRRAPARQPPSQPGKRCAVLDFPNTPETRSLIVEDVAAPGQHNTFLGGGVVAKCRGQDITITADSAESYGAQRTHFLIGNVHYREPRVALDAQRMTYFQSDERLLAEIAVQARMSDGSTMTGPRAEYFRNVPPIRSESRIIATEHPVFLLVQKDSVTGQPKQTNLVADHVTAVNDSLYYAGGAVTITNDDVVARGDSAVMNQTSETARLMRTPSIQGRGEQPFSLTGVVIDLFSKNRQLQRVIAGDSGHVVSKDITLKSDTIDLRVASNKLERAYAWGPSRAHATSPDRDIFADSIMVVMPRQQIREVHALRGAYAETAPDTAKLTSTERDWVKGDTLVATFDSTPPRADADTSSRNRLRQLVANGDASSFYQIPSSKGKAERPSINYVKGRLITVALDSGSVQKVTVIDQASGVYLEPSSDTLGTKRSATQRRQPAQPRRTPARPPTRRRQ